MDLLNPRAAKMSLFISRKFKETVFKTLAEGQSVEFEEGMGQKGPQATQVVAK